MENPLKRSEFTAVAHPVDAGRHRDLIPGSALSSRSAGPDQLIRRVVRPYLPEARACYEAELLHHPGLEGRIAVRFTIGAKGQVTASTIQSSTIGDATVETCAVEMIKKCPFPKPLGGGPVTVLYTFEFAPLKPT